MAIPLTPNRYKHAQRLFQAKSTVPSTGSPGRKSRCQSFGDVIQAKLEVGLTAQRIYQDLVAEHFPGAVEIVDFYHALEHL